MFLKFAKSISERLFADRFDFFTDEYSFLITEETEAIPLVKIIGHVIYLVFIINGDISSFSEIDDLIIGYELICSEMTRNNSQKNNFIFLLLFLTENPQSILEQVQTEQFTAGKMFYKINWIVDMTKKSLIVPLGEIEKVSNIDNLILLALTNDELELENQFEMIDLKLLQENILAETMIPLKSKNVLLTGGIILINIIMFLLMEVFGSSYNHETLLAFGANNYMYVVKNREYYRLFSSMFLHIGLWHLALNCMSLYIYGTRVEKYFGKLTFLIIYIISGMSASIVSILSSRNVISAGASGAIFGLLGSILAITLSTKKTLDNLDLYTVCILSISSIGVGLFVPGIDNFAHAGGLISGFLVGKLLLKYNDFF